jgi:hypothetical protein
VWCRRGEGRIESCWEYRKRGDPKINTCPLMAADAARDISETFRLFDDHVKRDLRF